MAALHSLLAIYGAFDQSVVEADDPVWTARVAQFLPGITGLDQHGWFSDIKGLVRRLAPDANAAEFPDLRAALDDLAEVANVVSGFSDPLTPPSDTDPPALTTTDIAQLLYIVAVGIRLAPEAPRTSVDFSAFLLPVAERAGPILGLAAEPMTTIYRASGRFSGPRSPETREAQVSRLVDLISNEFTGHHSWPDLMARAFDQSLVSLEVATSPIMLAGIQTGADHPNEGSYAAAAVAQVDGHYCAVLTTDCWQADPTLTVDAVKAIVDPRNWARLSPFFCQMDRLALDVLGASQVLEHVSTDKDSYQLTTALKNWRKDFDGGGVVNYELADHRIGTGDCGLVLVDSGYIHISEKKATDETVQGVRIKTSKWVAIEGVSVTATAMYMLSLGWAAAGNAMLFDNAVNPPGGDPLVAWLASPGELGPIFAGAGAGDVKGQPGSPPPRVPAGAAGALIKEAALMWADCVNITTTEATKVVDKWYKGALTVQDLVDYTSAVGGRLASEPFRYLGEMSKRIAATPKHPDNPPGKAEGGSP